MTKKKTKLSARKTPRIKRLSPRFQQILQEGYGLQLQGQIAQAQSLYLRILEAYPKNADANYLIGVILFSQGLNEDCQPYLRQAVLSSPNNTKILMGYGTYLHKTNQFKSAADVFEKLVALKPNDINFTYNLGASYIKLNRFHEAVECYEKVLAIQPNHEEALSNMGNAQIGLCNIEDACSYYAKAIKQNNKFLSSVSNELFACNYLETLSPEDVYQKHVGASKYFPEPEWSIEKIKKTNQKIRVAYLSADFRNHSVAYFLLPLISCHDKSRFEIYCYYNGDCIDQTTEDFRLCSDHWEQTSSMNDDALASLIRGHHIDIIVDLSGHTGHNRLPVLAKRVAPIQVTWLGYPHSTGLKSMDYRIVDEVTDPMSDANYLSREKLIRLEGGFICYRGEKSIACSHETPYSRNGFITFGSFNNLAKVNEGVIAAWIEILDAVPNSKLVIKAKQLGETSVRNRYLGYFENAGISTERIQLLAYVVGSENHLSLYHEIDIALDTFPYNGTTTTCEALWMGVPTVTFSGDRHAGRVGASIMKHSGFEEFIAQDIASYKMLSVDIAKKPNMLVKRRSEIRNKMLSSDLCNEIQFARKMEKSFQEMYLAEWS